MIPPPPNFLLKQFDLIAIDIKTVKHSWFSPCTGTNRVVFVRWSRLLKTISAPFTRSRSYFCIRLWHLVVARECDVIADVDSGWGDNIMPTRRKIYALNLRFDSRLICLIFPALAYGICSVSDQGTTMCASDLHISRASILNPFNYIPISNITLCKNGRPHSGLVLCDLVCKPGRCWDQTICAV